MKLQLARKLLSVLSLLLAAVILYLGVDDIYFGEDPVGHEPVFSGYVELMILLFISAFPILGSYVLWPK